jgi:hypothetical protein
MASRSIMIRCRAAQLRLAIHIHETEIKMAKMVEMVEMVEIILTWTLPKVKIAEITSYYIILIRYK